MNQYYHELMRFLNRMGPQELFYALIAVLLLGLFFLKGFGSRKKY